VEQDNAIVEYNILRKLLQWLERCRPGIIEPIDYPYRAFTQPQCDRQHRVRLSLQELRAIMKACEGISKRVVPSAPRRQRADNRAWERC